MNALSSTAMPVVLVDWTPRPKGVLRGFCAIRLGKLIIRDLTVCASDGKFWVGMPAKPQIGSDGVVLRDARGKAKYVPQMEWADRNAKDRFTAGVIAAIRAAHGPEALANDA